MALSCPLCCTVSRVSECSWTGWQNARGIRICHRRFAPRREAAATHIIEIRGFGSFALNYRPSRTGRNPKTGEPVKVPAKCMPHFKAGKELKERVDYK